MKNKFKSLIIKYNSMSNKEFFFKILLYFYRWIRGSAKKMEYSLFDKRLSNNDYRVRIIDNKINAIELPIDNNYRFVVEQNMTGVYDLLGQGPVSFLIDNDSVEAALKQQSSRFYRHSISIKRMLPSNYRYKNWFKNYKNKPDWCSATLSSDIKYGSEMGSDIKYPWEFSRLYHLPQFAIYARNERHRTDIIDEIKHQILDFYMANPVGFGPNWVCPMDVGIRVVNIIVAIYIISDFSEIDEDFNLVLNNLVCSHQNYIIDHLEYSPELTSNHYVANIVSLLFTSIFSESTLKTDATLKFSISEIFREIENQYLDDGLTYELTSSYHRLTTEMFLYAISLILGCENEIKLRIGQIKDSDWSHYPSISYNIDKILPVDIMNRLQKACLYDILLTKNNGDVPQFGDNDSGRFIKLSIYGETYSFDLAYERYLNLQDFALSSYNPFNGMYFDESFLNHTALHSKYYALIGVNNMVTLDGILIKSFSNMVTMPNLSKINKLKKPINFTKNNIEFDYVKSTKINFPDKSFSVSNLSLFYLECSNVVIIKGGGLYLSFYCLPNGSGAHTHNDALSLELSWNNDNLIVDPGTYLYTSDPNERNKYRSIQAHNCIRTEFESNPFFGNGNFLFSKELKSISYFERIDIDDSEIMLVACCEYNGIYSRRKVKINNDELLITDCCSMNFDNKFNPSIYYSKSFGVLESNTFNDGFKLNGITIDYEV